MNGWDHYDDPNFGPVLLGFVAALLVALIVFSSFDSRPAPDPATTIPPPVYVHPEEEP